MWEAIRSNTIRSRLLIGLMGAVLVGLGFVIGLYVEPTYGGAIGAVAALVVWLVMTLTALFQGDRLLLGTMGARRIEKEDAPRLWNVVEEMTLASGIGKMPRLYIIEDDSPNAFATGRNPEKAAVAVTSGLLKRLNRDELQGVIAHEIAHIHNYDIRFMTLAAVMVGSIALIGDLFFRSVIYGGHGRRRTSSKGNGQAQLIIFAVAMVAAILAPIFAQLLYLACSRRREYLADASAARFTRYPDGLASALEKITAEGKPLKTTNRAVAPMFIVNPLKGLSAIGLFATHPPPEKRINILRSMSGGVGYVDYEAAYRKIEGERAHLLGERTLSSEQGTSIAARGASAEPEPKQDAIEQAREVNDLLDRIANFTLLPCVCGVRIKVPPDFKRSAVPCPRCGRENSIPHAEEVAAQTEKSKGRASSQTETSSLRFERKGGEWESFRCSCDRSIQLSPDFEGGEVECPGCRRRIEITQKKG